MHIYVYAMLAQILGYKPKFSSFLEDCLIPCYYGCFKNLIIFCAWQVICKAARISYIP